MATIPGRDPGTLAPDLRSVRADNAFYRNRARFARDCSPDLVDDERFLFDAHSVPALEGQYYRLAVSPAQISIVNAGGYDPYSDSFIRLAYEIANRHSIKTHIHELDDHLRTATAPMEIHEYVFNGWHIEAIPRSSISLLELERWVVDGTIKIHLPPKLKKNWLGWMREKENCRTFGFSRRFYDGLRAYLAWYYADRLRLLD